MQEWAHGSTLLAILPTGGKAQQLTRHPYLTIPSERDYGRCPYTSYRPRMSTGRLCLIQSFTEWSITDDQERNRNQAATEALRDCSLAGKSTHRQFLLPGRQAHLRKVMNIWRITGDEFRSVSEIAGLPDLLRHARFLRRYFRNCTESASIR